MTDGGDLPGDGDRPRRPRRPPGPSGDPEVGSVGEEAAKLVGALAEWANERGGGDVSHGLGGLAGAAAGLAGEVNEHLATGSAECRYCPVCRAVHLVRSTSPEVRTHLSAAASSLFQAAAGYLATLPPPGSTPPSRGGFERIDLDGPDDAPRAPDEPDEPDQPDEPDEDGEL